MTDHRSDLAGLRVRTDAQARRLLEESEGFQNGRYLECVAGSDQPSAPGWAWLNCIAHGSRHDLSLVAAQSASSDCSGLTAFMAYLAAEVLATADSQGVPLEMVQRTTLIPLELALSRQPSRPFEEAVGLANDILAILENQNDGQAR